MKVVIATHNEDKLKEIKNHLESFSFNVLSLNSFPKIGEIIEDGKTLTDNALIKAREVFEKTGLPTISDDTGLEVDALDGKPGVYSARYAGEKCSYSDNVHKLLQDMNRVPIPNRTAQFKTVMVFKDKKQDFIDKSNELIETINSKFIQTYTYITYHGCTVCPGSLYSFYIVTYYIKWVKTS